MQKWLEQSFLIPSHMGLQTDEHRVQGNLQICPHPEHVAEHRLEIDWHRIAAMIEMERF